jgi:hypothetical protein
MKISYTHYPCAGFRGNSPKLNAASFAGHLENTATAGWKNGLYITLHDNDDSHWIMFWKYPVF